MMVLLEIIAASMKIGDKVVVFSQRLPCLNFIERTLATKRWGGLATNPSTASSCSEPCERTTWGAWKKGEHYFRLDGKSKTKERQERIKAGALGVTSFVARAS